MFRIFEEILSSLMNVSMLIAIHRIEIFIEILNTSDKSKRCMNNIKIIIL